MNAHDRDTVKMAEGFARAAHIKQRYGDEDYSYHLNAVVQVLDDSGYGSDSLMICAGWLHDILEDTQVTHAELDQVFSFPMLADLVFAVTDEQGSTRAERKIKTLLKIQEFGTKAIALKLADRIANVEHSLERRNFEKLKMYLGEHKGFYDALTGDPRHSMPRTLTHMWERLGLLMRKADDMMVLKSHTSPAVAERGDSLTSYGWTLRCESGELHDPSRIHQHRADACKEGVTKAVSGASCAPHTVVELLSR